MVLHILLSLFDALTAFVLVTHAIFGWFSVEIVLYHAAYVIIKGMIFALHDWASRIDILSGVYMVLVAFNIFSFPTIIAIAALWLSSKTISIVGGAIFKTFF